MAVLEVSTEVGFGRLDTATVIELPPTKSWPIRSYELGWIDGQPAIRYKTQRVAGGVEYVDEYLVDVVDDAVMFAKQDNDADVYEVRTNQCNCSGFGRHGHCKHVELAKLVRTNQ